MWRCMRQWIMSIGSDNGLSPVRHLDIIWANQGLLLIGSLETSVNEIWLQLRQFTYKIGNWIFTSPKMKSLCFGQCVNNYCRIDFGSPIHLSDSGLKGGGDVILSYSKAPKFATLYWSTYCVVTILCVEFKRKMKSHPNYQLFLHENCSIQSYNLTW